MFYTACQATFLIMVSKNELKEFIDDCISTGRCVETTLKLTQSQILEIEDILNRYNDTTAKTKIRKVLLNVA